MPAALIQNRAGRWVSCATSTVAAAAATRPRVNARDFSIVDADGANSYPISGYSWIVAYKNNADRGRARVALRRPLVADRAARPREREIGRLRAAAAQRARSGAIHPPADGEVVRFGGRSEPTLPASRALR